MKKHLIYLVLLCICISCNNIENEELFSSEQIKTKTLLPDKYLLTITTNLDKELILYPSITPVIGNTIHKEIAFKYRYTDTLTIGDCFWVMPYPVRGKKWVGIEGDYTNYNTSLDNDCECPYFEGFVNGRNLNIHLIYQDSIPKTEGNTGEKPKEDPWIRPEDRPTDDREPDLILFLYYAYTRASFNDEYELIFKIHSGFFTEDGSEMNPMYGEPVTINYAFWGQMTESTTLIPESDYYVLKLKLAPEIKNRQLFISIPDQKIKKFNYLVTGETQLITLY